MNQMSKWKSITWFIKSHPRGRRRITCRLCFLFWRLHRLRSLWIVLFTLCQFFKLPRFINSALNYSCQLIDQRNNSCRRSGLVTYISAKWSLINLKVLPCYLLPSVLSFAEFFTVARKMGKAERLNVGAPGMSPQTEASKLLEAALLQMDGIISG